MYANLIAAAALLAAPLVKAASFGEAIVDNQCTFPVYLWSVAATSGSMVTVPSGSNYSETFRLNSNGGGVSIKIAAEKDQNAGVTQFEYTLSDPNIWYDISNINGYPFEAWGVTLEPTDSNCPQKSCEAGVELCTNAYNVYNDDAATAMCEDTADLVLVLCSGAGASSTTTTTASATSTKSTSTVAASTTKSTSVAKSTSTSTSTIRQTSTTTKTTGTTFITSATSSATSSVVTSVVVATSSNANEVVITTYVTSWTTVDGNEPTSTSAAAAETSSASNTWSHGGHHHNKGRSEERQHVHRHPRDVVA